MRLYIDYEVGIIGQNCHIVLFSQECERISELCGRLGQGVLGAYLVVFWRSRVVVLIVLMIF